MVWKGVFFRAKWCESWPKWHFFCKLVFVDYKTYLQKKSHFTLFWHHFARKKMPFQTGKNSLIQVNLRSRKSICWHEAHLFPALCFDSSRCAMNVFLWTCICFNWAKLSFFTWFERAFFFEQNGVKVVRNDISSAN